MPSNSAEITALLEDSKSDATARDAVFKLVYDDLRRLAGHRIASSRPGQTLSVTALVNEAYLKLTDRTAQQWNDRGHFLRVASRAMRQITIDHVRAKLRKKRGSGEGIIPLGIIPLDQMQLAAVDENPDMVLAIEQGLQELGEQSPRLVEVVECRFFTGLTVAETALALDVSTRTVERDWDRAKDWLKRFLSD